MTYRTNPRILAVLNARGDASETSRRYGQAQDCIRAFLVDAPTGDEQAEALLDLATASSNLARGLIVATRYAEAIGALTEATDAIVALRAGGYRASPTLLDNTRAYWEAVGKRSGDEALRNRAQAGLARLAGADHRGQT